MLMPWGKHKGQEISTIPVGYCKWLWHTSDFPHSDRNSRELKMAIAARLEIPYYSPGPTEERALELAFAAPVLCEICKKAPANRTKKHWRDGVDHEFKVCEACLIF